MSEPGAPEAGPFSPRRLLALVGAGAVAAAIGFALPAGPAVEAWYLAVVTAAGLAVGALALLMLGHVLGEDWLDPVRAEIEAASRTVPLLALFCLPLAWRLPELFPWTSPAGQAALTAPERLLYGEPFFLGRAAIFLAIWCGLSFWVTGTTRPRRASAIGIALLAITIHGAVLDWVMSRDPAWRSGLFPFAFALNQLLAALAGAILLSLGRGENPERGRMMSLERALVALIGLALWTWFSHFLVVWMANLPAEAAFYLRRGGPWLLPLLLSVGALVGALLLLVPSGVGRRTMMAGAVLALAAHGLHGLWLIRPFAPDPTLTIWDAVVPGGLALVWAAWFATAYQRRPSYASERAGAAPQEPDRAWNPPSSSC